MSPRLRCTVRGCGRPLERSGPALGCAEGHAFDRAREGYWNLLQPQDRRSPRAGDRAEALAARRRWLARGFADPLVEILSSIVKTLALPPDARVVDVGCGEGTIASRLFGGCGEACCGLDLSTAAIRMAARLHPGATWIVANADRILPFEDASVDLALSVFGRRPAGELARVLAPGAMLLAVVPGPDDLAELREEAMGERLQRDRVPEALAALAPRLELVARTRWTTAARHDETAIADALVMTYRGVRASQRRRLADLSTSIVTLDAEVLLLQNSRP